MDLSYGIDLAGYSMLRSQANIMAGIETQVLKKTMDLQEAQGSQLVQMMEQTVNSVLGQNMDIRI